MHIQRWEGPWVLTVLEILEEGLGDCVEMVRIAVRGGGGMGGVQTQGQQHEGTKAPKRNLSRRIAPPPPPETTAFNTAKRRTTTKTPPCSKRTHARTRRLALTKKLPASLPNWDGTIAAEPSPSPGHPAMVAKPATNGVAPAGVDPAPGALSWRVAYLRLHARTLQARDAKSLGR